MVDEYPEISGITNAREAMKKMPEPDRAKIAEQVRILIDLFHPKLLISIKYDIV